MKRAEGTDVRQYCSESDCNIVESGFHLLQFFSCKTCKRECSESLKNRVDKKDNDQLELDIYNGWTLGHKWTP